MKKFIFCFCLVFVLGCAVQGPIKNIITDQQFAGYKAELEQLEKDYLHKKITYAQYLQEKKRVEEGYQKKIDARRDLIQNQNTPNPVSEMVP